MVARILRLLKTFSKSANYCLSYAADGQTNTDEQTDSCGEMSCGGGSEAEGTETTNVTQ